MEKNKPIYWQGLKSSFVDKIKLKLKLALIFLGFGAFHVHALPVDSYSNGNLYANSTDLVLQASENVIASAEEQESERLITGVIKDESDMPIPGVTVVVKGTTNGTISQIDGSYRIEVSESAEILVFSFIGMENQEITVGSQKIINCILKSSDVSLDEVAIIAYGSKKKVTITGAISSIKNEDLVKIPVSSVSNMLSGSVSGISSVQYSGQPGADDAQLFVRGIANPLVLVDGVERSFSQIDPNEIADVTVLKDASSTAVFGVRGANGVILVTTRRGTEGAPKISLSSEFGLQVPTNLGKYVNAKDFMSYVNETDVNDGRSPSYGQTILDAYEDPNRNQLIYPDTDWQELLYDNLAVQHKHNVNISGGTKTVRYFTSVGMFSQDGIFNGNENLDNNGNFTFKRYNLRANLDIDVTKSTLVSFNLGGRIENRNAPRGWKENTGSFFRAIIEGTPLGGAGMIDGERILNNPFYTNDQTNSMGWYPKGIDARSRNVLNLDFKIKQKLDFITKGLNVSLKGSYNSTYDHNKLRTYSRPSYMPWYRKDIPWMDAPASEEVGNEVILIKEGDYGATSISESTGRARNFYTELAINYKQSFGQHNVSGLLMYNMRRTYYPRTFTDLPTAYVGLVGRTTYNYDTRYLFDFSIGYNGSENFHSDRRYGVFPSASVGWVLTQENFLKENSIVDYLKLRGSYGIVGKDNAPRYMYLPDNYNFGGGYNFGAVSGATWQSGAREGQIGNEYTSWEKAYKQNYGIDMRFLDSRLSVYFDYFIEKREGRLISRQTYPTFVAFKAPTVNLGKRENKGMELSLGWKSEVNEFKYNISLNASYSKNVEKYFDEVPNAENPWTLRTGEQVGQPFGYDFLGFYQDGMLNNQGVDAKETQPSIAEGDCVYADMNGDGKIDTNDRVALGYSNNPLFTAGINMGFEWKGFSLSMGWTGATGVSRVLGGVYREPLGPTGNRSLMQEQFDNRWTPETATTATLPRASLSGLSANSQISSLWIKDASYIRLKTVRLGYSIESELFKSLGMDAVNVYVTGYNLLTFDKLGLLDPETRTQGDPTYPMMKVYNLGLNITF